MKVYKIEAHSYPTPDGKPFDWQSVDDYELATQCYWGGIDKDQVPEWLRHIDLSDWVWGYQHDYFEGQLTAPKYSGKTIISGSEYLLNVPYAHRKHYFSRSAAKQVVDRLRMWGAIVDLMVAEVTEWQTVGDAS